MKFLRECFICLGVLAVLVGCAGGVSVEVVPDTTIEAADPVASSAVTKTPPPPLVASTATVTVRAVSPTQPQPTQVEENCGTVGGCIDGECTSYKDCEYWFGVCRPGRSCCGGVCTELKVDVPTVPTPLAPSPVPTSVAPTPTSPPVENPLIEVVRGWEEYRGPLVSKFELR
jgi:hypothetical protein